MAQSDKDFYKVLGLTEGEKNLPWEEFTKIEKQKYKELAKKYHPDRWTNKSEQERKDAEEKFKDIAEAHEVLSDEKKKSEYDNPMKGAFGGGNPFGGGFNPFGEDFDPFSFFGGGRRNGRTRQKTVQKGNSIRVQIPFTLEELYNGVHKTIKYKRQEPCHACHGKGYGADGKLEMCPTCGGTGMKLTINGSMQMMTTCPHCGGSGKILKNPCRCCGGSGLEQKDHEVEVDIPKGVMEGMELTIQGEGGLTPNADGIPGDLIVRVVEQEHDTFVRRGNDLLFEINVPVVDAILGTKMNVSTIDGKTLSTNIASGIEDGTNIKFANKGMPIYGKNGRFGHMIGIVKLVMPKKLNEEEKQLLNQLKEQEHFKK